MGRMSKGESVVDAFKMVFASKICHSRWIPDCCIADSIRYEYGIPENKSFSAADVNSALSKNRAIKTHKSAFELRAPFDLLHRLNY